MILAIDGYEANIKNRVGIGRYAYEILRNLYALLAAGSGSGHSVRVYLPSTPLPDMPKETSWWRYRMARPGRLWTFIGLPLALRLDRPKVDVVFSPTHYIPRHITTPKVMSIMDMSFVAFPDMFAKKDLYQLTAWTAHAARHAAVILTISEFSKNAIIRAYGVPEKRVVVTYPGLTMDKHSKPKKQETGDEYILSVGTIQPRKNYTRLIEAFSLALPELAKTYPNLRLVIVGKKGWLYEDILSAPARFGVADKVKFLEFVPDSDLAGWYENALCFALPSLYEGFGLPVLEAMAYKTPVVISHVSSLPEIAGEAGIYVEPESAQSVAGGLVTAIKERGTPIGKKRIQDGLSQVKKFSWEKAARETLAVLTEVGGGA